MSHLSVISDEELVWAFKFHNPTLGLDMSEDETRRRAVSIVFQELLRLARCRYSSDTKFSPDDYATTASIKLFRLVLPCLLFAGQIRVYLLRSLRSVRADAHRKLEDAIVSSEVVDESTGSREAPKSSLIPRFDKVRLSLSEVTPATQRMAGLQLFPRLDWDWQGHRGLVGNLRGRFGSHWFSRVDELCKEALDHHRQEIEFSSLGNWQSQQNGGAVACANLEVKIDKKHIAMVLAPLTPEFLMKLGISRVNASQGRCRYFTSLPILLSDWRQFFEL